MNILNKRTFQLAFFIPILTLIASCSTTFPISKRTTGFNVKKTNKARVLHKDNAYLFISDDIDSLIEFIEKKHGLSTTEPIDLVLCISQNGFRKFTKSNVRAKSYSPRGRIFLNAKLLNQYGNQQELLYIYIKHEISHSIVSQHRSFRGFLRFPGWLDEGMATLFSGMVGNGGYLSKEKVKATIQRGIFFEPEWWGLFWLPEKKESKAFDIPDKYFFIYSEFALIVQDLIDLYGEESFFQYYRNLLDGQKNENAFVKQIQISFADYINKFKKKMSE